MEIDLSRMPARGGDSNSPRLALLARQENAYISKSYYYESRVGEY
jgi:hypothetical protein